MLHLVFRDHSHRLRLTWRQRIERENSMTQCCLCHFVNKLLVERHTFKNSIRQMAHQRIISLFSGLACLSKFSFQRILWKLSLLAMCVARIIYLTWQLLSFPRCQLLALKKTMLVHSHTKLRGHLASWNTRLPCFWLTS